METKDTVLFQLDDSLDLVALVKTIAIRNGLDFHAAHSLAAGNELATKAGKNAKVALIDLMIPVNEADLAKVNELLLKRNEFGRVLTKRGLRGADYEQARQDAILKLDTIDKQIMELIADDGGIQFMQNNKQFLANVKVAVFSARRPKMPIGENGQTLESLVIAALDRAPEVWFEKPVSPLDIEQWLKEQTAS